MTCLLLGPENSENRTFNRLVKRLIHLWCQSTENALIDGDILQTECPDPTLRSKIHPFMRSSRRMGNRCVRQALCKQFLARGGGYVTTRYEVSLKRLGIVSERSSLANLASTEFVARQLQMSSVWIENHFTATETKKYGFKVINFALDESRVCQQQARLSTTCSWAHWLLGIFLDKLGELPVPSCGTEGNLRCQDVSPFIANHDGLFYVCSLLLKNSLDTCLVQLDRCCPCS